ncbi:endonuclease/exonuclease/phosphatase family protein [Parenemella sanctibonifatiensis]|uniref:Endonuclease/exonuclease/phosphatase domain-containing protein n=1 Tax=Parenemella sanctibonifatiensis TaxID=2016505 RepID=A0A255ENN8_9ACTN|nr:endonuclease/exonuclease/phosphatase family protein [Parenemella sanctibonifatiensis]OYN91205.1 hypothetical protein CGZ91_07055 [Parenemella sanctibonifatiensis]
MAASVHFGLDPADRLRHARQLVGLIGSAQAPVVIGGDFNETIDGTARAVVARVAGDPGDPADPTFPASGPVRRIDGIHVSDGMSVRSAEVVTRTPSVPPEQMARASDHLPVVVDTDLR